MTVVQRLTGQSPALVIRFCCTGFSDLWCIMHDARRYANPGALCPVFVAYYVTGWSSAGVV
jgi:hypothetical protein